MRFEFQCLPSQAKAHALKSKYRGFSGPVGSGKTAWLIQHLLYLAERNRGRWGLLAGPTFRMLRDSAERALFETADQLKIPLVHHKGDSFVEIPEFGGTKILLRTLDNPDRLRGPNLAFFAVDEASYAPEASWLQLEARLRDPLAKEKAGIGAWTPKGFNWLYRKFIRQDKPMPQYEAVLANPFENTYLDAGFYNGLLDSYAANFGKQEVFGEYLNVFSGRAYDSFSSDPRGNIWRGNGENYKGFLPCAYHRERPILWSLDFNVTPATSVIAQTIVHTPDVLRNQLWNPPKDTRIGGNDKQLNVLDELYLPDTNTERHCEALYEKVRPKLQPGMRMHVIVYGDASGDRRQSSASESDYAIIRRFFSRRSQEFVCEFRVPESNPLVKDRINAVNAMCSNYNGTRRIAVHERCKMLIRDLEEVSFASDGNENLLPVLSSKNPALTHISDALGYLVAREFPIRGMAGFKGQHIH